MVDATITVLDRGRIECDMNYLVEGYSMGTHENPDPKTDIVDIPVFNLVVDHPEGTILWDTGVHHEALDGYWPDGAIEAFYPRDVQEHRLDDDLEDAGYSVKEIDYIFQTHLHQDHAGGLEFFAGTDTPIFVNEKELKFAYYCANTDEESGAYNPKDFDHNLNWQILHQKREEHFEDVEFIHLPGHTPGLTGTLVHLDDVGPVLFASDEIYQSANYEEEIPLGADLMWSHRHWYDSLQQLEEIERRQHAEVVYSHDLEQFNEIKSGW